MAKPEGEGILAQADKIIKKENFIQWIKDNVASADRCIVVMTYKKPDGKTGLKAAQFGFDFAYEIDGFLDMVPDLFVEDEEEDDSELSKE